MRSLASIGPFSLERAALFLDFDGTLVPIADRPDAVKVGEATIALLDRLMEHTAGALAVVSGRPVATLQKLLAPATPALAGSHGLELKLPDGELVRQPVDEIGLERAVDLLREFSAGDRRLIVEEKPASVALHFRQAPEMQVDCEALAQKIVRERRSLHLLKGKMVVEIKAARGDKGAAVEELMKLKPFEGRLPVFAGDDITDETAFKAVQRRDGITIKVGDGETAARYRAADIAQLHDWLSRQATGNPPRPDREGLHKRAALS